MMKEENIINKNIEEKEKPMEPLTKNIEKSCKGFKALGDETRIQILLVLKDGEKCACKLLESLEICQSTLSHHMKILGEADLVQGRKEGKWTHYSLKPEGWRSTIATLKTLSGQETL